MSETIKKLLYLIEHYRLTRDHPEFAFVEHTARAGRLSDDYARQLLVWLEPIIEGLERFPRHLLDVPTAEDLAADGPPDIELGSVEGQPDTRIGIRFKDRPRGMIIAGSVGGGKTTIVRNIVVNADQVGQETGSPRSIFIKQRKGNEIGDVRKSLGKHWHIFGSEHGAWLGPNAPLGVPSTVWINIFCTLFAAAGGLIAGAGVLAETISWLLHTMQEWPSLHLVLDVLRAAPFLFSEKPEYAQSTIAVLQNVTRASGDLFRTGRGIDVEALVQARQSAVFELGLLQPPWLRVFVCWLISAQCLFSRISRNVHLDTTDVIMIDDDADQDLSREFEARLPDGLSPLVGCYKFGRELGILPIAGVHVVETLSRQVQVNAPYQIYCNISDSKSIGEAAATLLLPRGAERLFPGLTPGTCLFRQAQSSFSSPFLARIDYLPPQRSTEPPEYEVPACPPYVPLTELPALQAALQARVASHFARKHPKAGKKMAMVLSINARKFLDWATLLPLGTPAKQVADRMGSVPSATQLAIRRELVRAQLVAFAKCRTGKVKRIVMEVLPQGYELVGKSPELLPGSGKLVHRTYMQWIRLAGVKQSLEVETECTIPGSSHRADVVWKHPDGHWTAFECVVTAAENLTTHVSSNLNSQSPVETMIVVASHALECERLSVALAAQTPLAALLSRVRFEGIEHYLLEALRGG